MRRSLALFAVLLVAYAAAGRAPAAPGERVGGEAAHMLLGAESVASDGNVELSDEYAARAWRAFTTRTLNPEGRITARGLYEPHGLGFPALLAPAWALGGARATQLLAAVALALAFVAGAALARRLAPEPWATGGTLAVALSPPALAAAASPTPPVVGAVLIALAALCALRVRERWSARTAFTGALLIVPLPWLSAALLPAGAVVLVALTLFSRRWRPSLGLVVGEVGLASVVFWATLNERLYGGLTPASVRLTPPPDFPLGYLDRLPGLIALWLDREVGLLRWAPVLAAGFFAIWVLYRSRRAGVARLVSGRDEAEACAILLLWVCGAQVATAALWWDGLRGAWFPGAHVVAALPCAAALTAWGLRHLDRRVAALLVTLTALSTVWVAGGLLVGDQAGWLQIRTRAPWGPLLPLFPDFEAAPVWAAVVSVVVALGAAAVAGREWRLRRSAGGRALL